MTATATQALDAKPKHQTSRAELAAALSLAEYHLRILDGMIQERCTPEGQAERLGMAYGKLTELRALLDKVDWTCVEVRAKEMRE